MSFFLRSPDMTHLLSVCVDSGRCDVKRYLFDEHALTLVTDLMHYVLSLVYLHVPSLTACLSESSWQIQVGRGSENKQPDAESLKS